MTLRFEAEELITRLWTPVMPVHGARFRLVLLRSSPATRISPMSLSVGTSHRQNGGSSALQEEDAGGDASGT